MSNRRRPEIHTRRSRVAGLRVRSDPIREATTSGVGLSVVIGAIAAQSTLIAAFLYYFGRAGRAAMYAYFGVDSSYVELSSTDNLSATLRPAFLPILLTGFGIAITVVGVRIALMTPVLTRLRVSHENLVWCVAVFASGAVVFGFALVLGLVPLEVGDAWKPLPILIGSVIAAAISASRRGRLKVVLTLSLAALSLFSLVASWAIYSVDAGIADAQKFASRLASEPAISVYSTERLGIAGPGVVAQDLSSSDLRYKFRYDGLRLLIHSGEKYILLPVGWRKGLDSVFVIEDADDVRIDVIASTGS